MTTADIKTLKAAGWKPVVLNALRSLGYQLDHHDSVNDVIEVSSRLGGNPRIPPHGFHLHRKESIRFIKEAIFSAGISHQQKQTHDAFQNLLTAASIQLR